jgi:hypothetical protein
VPGQEKLRWQEQNFNTVIHTLGIRSNITFLTGPIITEVKGNLIGFDTEKILRAWRFDWFTDREDLYIKGDDPLGLLKDDFMLVPYISGLNEAMEQKYTVFNTGDPGKNIVFFQK